jgi:cathepsin D
VRGARGAAADASSLCRSSDLWVVGSSCKGCSSASPFDSSKSSSFKADTSGQKVTISYGSGAVRGTLAEDAVSFAGFSVSQQVFRASRV